MQILIGKMKINIAGGTGIMGKVHKSFFERNGHEVILSGRSTSPGLEDAAKMSDLTIVSVPIPATEEIIRRVGPYANSLMDFTGLKVFPVEAMLRYSREGCEVAGLHPLYGEVNSLEGRTIVYCPTEKSGKICLDIVDIFQKSGVEIKEMTPEKHDLYMGISQNARLILFESFALLMERHGINYEELYSVSPPPTRILLDLIARQANSSNDELYNSMREYNPSTPEVIGELIEIIGMSNGERIPQKVRDLFGEGLKEAQDRAKRLIDG